METCFLENLINNKQPSGRIKKAQQATFGSYVPYSRGVNMVDSSFKFLLKEKDLKVILNLSPSQDFCQSFQLD